MSISIKYYLIILILLNLSCTSPDDKIFEQSGEIILFTEISRDGKKLKVFNVMDNKEYYINDVEHRYDNDYKLFGDELKLIVFPNYGFDGDYFIYDFKTRKRLDYKIKKNQYVVELFLGYDVYNDSLLIFAGNNNLYTIPIGVSQAPDTIPFEYMNFANLSVSSKGIIAINYNADVNNSPTLIQIPDGYKELVLIDLNTREKLGQKNNVLEIGNWSNDGKFLIYTDSTKIRLLEYPSLEITELIGLDENFMIYHGFNFLNDSLITFSGIKNDDDDQANTQLFLYDFRQKKIIDKLTISKSEKSVLDVN